MILKVIFFTLVAIGLAIMLESPTARVQFTNELNSIRLYVNSVCSGYEAWQLIAVTIGATILLFQMIQVAFYGRESVTTMLKLKVFKMIRSLPPVKSRIKSELEKARKGLEESFLKTEGTVTHRSKLPETGLTHDEILEELQQHDNLTTYDWRNGRVSGCAYNCSEDITKLANAVYSKYCWTNPLHVGVFPEIRKMEAEIVSWCAKLFNGGPDACGTMTSGGTESILLAMRAYREWGYSKGIQYPEIVGSTATHAAFIKAADYFCMKFVPIPCDPLTRMVNLKKMKQAINGNTVVLVGNAPQYPYGIIDPIEDIAKLGLKYGLGVHVDCCLGGFILPFMDKAGYPIDPFDFRVKGVTSISADTHKYGYSPKGSSVILYCNKEWRRRQFFVATDTEIGLYPSATLAGSRAGGLIAATWAVMMYMGVNGYVENARKVIETTRWLAKEINAIPGVRIVGTPLACALGFTSDDVGIYSINTAMCKKGWELSPLQFPPGLHISVTVPHTRGNVAQLFVSDIKKSVEELRADSSKKVDDTAAFYGTSQTIPDRSIIADATRMFIDVCYMSEK